jgi:hypothetical protein
MRRRRAKTMARHRSRVLRTPVGRITWLVIAARRLADIRNGCKAFGASRKARYPNQSSQSLLLDDERKFDQLSSSSTQPSNRYEPFGRGSVFSANSF